ncbi:MAG: hypothetical protein ACJ74J_07495, partial [Blastocatellia bacterium]
ADEAFGFDHSERFRVHKDTLRLKQFNLIVSAKQGEKSLAHLRVETNKRTRPRQASPPQCHLCNLKIAADRHPYGVPP